VNKMNYDHEGMQDTNSEAMASKLSAIAKGYINDPFAHFFVKTHAKKDVIIHRGYWCRVSIFRSIINKFLLSAPTVPKQIISLGSGYDTL